MDQGWRADPRARLFLVGCVALSGCALNVGQGWATRTPDAFPRATTVSARGPFVRESENLFGAELQVEEDREAFRVRRGGLVYAHRVADRSLGVDGPWLEVGAAAGGGRGNFDPGGDHLGAYGGVRAEAGVPLVAAPRARRAEVRLLLLRADLFVFGHGDVIVSDDPVVEAQAGLGLRFTVSTDTEVKKAIGDFL